MLRLISLLLSTYVFVLLSGPPVAFGQDGAGLPEDGLVAKQASPEETLAMLNSLTELQSNLRKQLVLTRERIRTSTSDAEKARLDMELQRLDRQLSDSSDDFERIATGVETALFVEKKSAPFSWKEEMTTLIEPAIKEIKRLTVRAREKTKLKDTISELSRTAPVANDAVRHLERLYAVSTDQQIKKQIKELLPEWHNTENRISNKLELARLELSQMENQEVSLVQGFSQSIGDFFRVRGLYLAVAVVVFGCIFLVGRLIHRLIFRVLAREKLENRPFHIRLFDILLRIFIVAAAIVGLFFVLYLAEDWFLLSLTIIFFLGFFWTVRQAVPRLWQQGRLMLNVGAVREGERVVLNDVPWRVENIYIFCQLHNPTLGIHLRLPIEEIIGLVSRPYAPEETWFPCKKGDWVVVGDRPRTRVISLSHELVETVERGGKRYVFQTAEFLAQNPVNLSRNYRLRVVFGVSYDLQAEATTTIPHLLKTFIEEKIKDEGYGDSCLNLAVEFKAAVASSLDLQVNADFKGDVADIYSKLERSIQRWCVDAATHYNWEIPFPQLTFHWPAQERQPARQVPVAGSSPTAG